LATCLGFLKQTYSTSGELEMIWPEELSPNAKIRLHLVLIKVCLIPHFIDSGLHPLGN